MNLTKEDISKLTVKCKKDANYYITLDCADNTKEIVYLLKCTLKEAEEVFIFVVHNQQQEYRKPNNNIKWRVVRLFDANNNQISQES